MVESDHKLFVGVKISKELQNGLDNPAPGTERYFKEDSSEFLQIITLGEEKLIGRFLSDGFPVSELEDIERNVRSILGLITRGFRLEADAVRIYVR